MLSCDEIVLHDDSVAYLKSSTYETLVTRKSRERHAKPNLSRVSVINKYCVGH